MSKAWVIGGSRGLGRGAADALAAQGSDLILSARPGARLDAAVADLRRRHPSSSVEALPLDLADAATVDAALEAALTDVPDAIVVSSGGPPPGAVTTTGLDALDDAYASLLRPTAQIVTAAGRAMTGRGSGVIVIITSSGVREPIPMLAASSIMRAGVTALMKCAATDFAPSGVRVLAVAPGRIATERVAELDAATAERRRVHPERARSDSEATIPLGRYGTTAEFGAVVAFACSPAAAYVTGTTIAVDGGKGTGLLG